MRTPGLLAPSVLASLVSCLGTEHRQAASGQAATPTQQAAVLAQPGPGPPGRPDPVSFDRDVAPIFARRCQPCHFPGGKMYERLPFDQATTIRSLGPALFSRIKDQAERARIQAFLDQAEPGPENLSESPMR